MLMRQRLSNFAFLRIDGVVRSVESDSLFFIFSVLFIMRFNAFLLVHSIYFMRQDRERERVCVYRVAETHLRPIRPSNSKSFQARFS